MQQWDLIKPFIFDQFSVKDAIEILLLGVIVYRLILLLQGTRAYHIIIGGLAVLVIYVIAYYYQMQALFAFLNFFFEYIVVIIVIIFSAEIKKTLAFFGSRLTLWPGRRLLDPFFMDRLEQAFVYFSSQYIGAIVAIERKHALRQYAESGTVIDARLSSPILVSIFNKNAPLHDGAVIISKNLRVLAASCILPLTSRIDLHLNFGTRHRAAIGLSEETDAIVIVVSEETGLISIFVDGIQHSVDKKNFKEMLELKMSA